MIPRNGFFHQKTRLPLASAMLIFLGTLMFLPISSARAEPYLRVNKKGVIYYYFSHREVDRAPRLVRTSGKIRYCRPPAGRRLSVQELQPIIEETGRRHNLPPSLIKAVIKVESNFNPAATSPKGAQGLMQLMPGTAESLQVADPYDIKENIGAGTRYLGMLLKKFNYRLPLALAAYNSGPQRVEQRQDIPPIRETQAFVRDVCANFLKFAGEPSAPGPK